MIYKKKGIFLSLILFFFLVLSWFCLFSRTKIIEPESKSESKNSLEKNGYQILSNIFQDNEISDFIQKSQQKEFQEIQKNIDYWLRNRAAQLTFHVPTVSQNSRKLFGDSSIFTIFPPKIIPFRN